ncbi:hypothetical protein VDG09_13410 [Xanthomonas campestris pv. raphani]|uniref:hypothetical protein n=1 Tax=Xanthomonas campestris TaxID=339 RepID=UPI0005AF2B6A|nr:hypothetical protein [Xanthomonas campestris]KIQ27797.1 membrane protein [Xanthomonas campestris]MEA9828642.1 hypothetical protein [Xanthomonas campestris pv. raphani]
MSDNVGLLVLLAGPIGASTLYWVLYQYYRNTGQSHAFERETLVDAKPVICSDTRIDTITGTQRKQIDGDNVAAYRTRVRRDTSQ